MASLGLHASKNTYVTEMRPDKNFYPEKAGYCGVDKKNNRYRYLIYFDLSALPLGIDLDSAVLKLYAPQNSGLNDYGNFTPSMITSSWNEDTVSWDTMPQCSTAILADAVRVGYPGWYQWDITKMAQMWTSNSHNNHGLVLKSLEDRQNDIKEFYTSYCQYCKPSLEIAYHSRPSVKLDSRGITNAAEEYGTKNELSYTNWVNTSSYSMYTFFLQNRGDSPAEAFVQISPDKLAIADERCIYGIDPDRTEAVVPVKYGFFTRIAFRSTGNNKHTRLQIWFQAQV